MASIPELKQNYPEYTELLKLIESGKLPAITAADEGKVLGVVKSGDTYVFAPITLNTENWVFTLEGGTTVTKKVVIME